MPLDYSIDPDRAHVCIVGTGPVSMRSMIAVVERVAADTHFSSHFTVTFDLRDVEYTAELGDGNTLAAVLRRKDSDFQNRFAVVVSEPLHFLARLYCALTHMAGFDKIECFTDMEEAREWCGAHGSPGCC